MNAAKTDHMADLAPATKWTWPDQLGWRSLIALFAVVATAYAIGARLAFFLIEASGLQGVFFIPAGITVGFLLRLSKHHWWIVLLAAGVTELTMDLTSGFTTAQAIGFTAANVIEPLVGAGIVTAACGRIDLARRRHVLWFIFGAVLVGPAVGAGIGAVADRAFGGDDLLPTFGQWWLGDALGVVLVGGAILAWGSSPDRRSPLSVGGLVLIGGSAVLTLALLTLTDYPVLFFVLVGMLVAGVVFGVRAVVLTGLAIAFTIAATTTVEPDSLRTGLSPAEALLLIKLQVGTFALAGLAVAAESHERELATKVAERAALQSVIIESERSRDRELALRVQRGLLPDRLLSLPGVDLAARYEAASDALEVGGDWYDAIELRDGRIGLVVGDIVGHGIDAMISMGRLRAALAALSLHNQSPAALLTQLNEFVGGPNGTGYATVFYAIVDLEGQTITYSSAGHPPGLLVSPRGETIWLDQGQTEPLHGEATSRREASVEFAAGSSLVLYSDGLVERRGESLTVGLERLERAASKLAANQPHTMCDELFQTLVPGPSQNDDIVVLVMRAAMDTGEYHQVFPALPEELRNIRSSLREWISARELGETVGDDLLICVGEATANAARHAYRDSIAGDVTVRITVADEALNVEVSDTGEWREPADPTSYPGLGTRLIESVSEGLTVDRTRQGTSVSFRLPLDARR